MGAATVGASDVRSFLVEVVVAERDCEEEEEVRVPWGPGSCPGGGRRRALGSRSVSWSENRERESLDSGIEKNNVILVFGESYFVYVKNENVAYNCFNIYTCIHT